MYQPHKTEKKYDTLWKIRPHFDTLNDTYAKFYNLSEYFAVDEVIVLFKDSVIFKQYIPKKHKNFDIKIYKLCAMTGYAYDMSVYLGKDRQIATQIMTVTHVKVNVSLGEWKWLVINFT
jgi:hypothetical protein